VEARNFKGGRGKKRRSEEEDRQAAQAKGVERRGHGDHGTPRYKERRNLFPKSRQPQFGTSSNTKEKKGGQKNWFSAI